MNYDIVRIKKYWSNIKWFIRKKWI